MKFDPHVTVKHAVDAVERFLSEPLTEEYYQTVRHDTYGEEPWDTAKGFMHVRGHCLGDARRLEHIEVVGGQMSFFIGS